MFHVDERTISKVTDDNGEVAKEDFIKIALENKLLDFGNVMAGGGGENNRNQKKTRAYSSYTTGQELGTGKVRMLLVVVAVVMVVVVMVVMVVVVVNDKKENPLLRLYI